MTDRPQIRFLCWMPDAGQTHVDAKVIEAMFGDKAARRFAEQLSDPGDREWPLLVRVAVSGPSALGSRDYLVNSEVVRTFWVDNREPAKSKGDG